MTETTKDLDAAKRPRTTDARRQRRQLRAAYALSEITLEELETALAELADNPVPNDSAEHEKKNLIGASGGRP